MHTHRPERLKTFDYLGLYRYFLTYCTWDRHPVFVTDTPVALVLSHILRAAVREEFAVLAYCFMPDHVHLLMEGLTDAADCRRFIARSKQLSGFHHQKACGVRLWQRYGYERTLRSDEATMAVIKYIVENPVRAGLVIQPADYPFLGSMKYTRVELLEAVQGGEAWRPQSG